MNEDFLYVVKKSLIIDEWKKRKFQIEKAVRIRNKNKPSLFDLKNKLADMFKKKLNKSNNSPN